MPVPQAWGRFWDWQLAFGSCDVFLGIALEYHAGAFQIEFPRRHRDLVLLLVGKLNGLFVGWSNLFLATCVDQQDSRAAVKFPYFGFPRAFTLTNGHANLVVSIVVLVFRIMMQDKCFPTDVPTKLFSKFGKSISCIAVFTSHANRRNQC